MLSSSHPHYFLPPIAVETRLQLSHLYSDLANDCTVGILVLNYPIPTLERVRYMNPGNGIPLSYLAPYYFTPSALENQPCLLHLCSNPTNDDAVGIVVHHYPLSAIERASCA